MLLTSFRQFVFAFLGREFSVKERESVCVLFYFFLFIWTALPRNTLTLISTHVFQKLCKMFVMSFAVCEDSKYRSDIC
jgi:hypothetical protein